MPGTVQFTVREGITRDEIHQLIDAYLRVTGCRTCGIAGWDFNLVQGDPASVEKLQVHSLKGVLGASVMLNPQPLPPKEGQG
jgi:hypothetical protein